MKKIDQTFLPLFVFFSIFGFVALTINAKTQGDFNLQQMGVESLVERHTFALEGSQVPQLQPLGDTFSFNDHIYAIKQPGQFVIGAVVYTVLRTLGLTYFLNYVLTASLVTLLSSGVLCGLTGVAIFLVATRLSQSKRIGVLIGLASCLATILLPYAGVAHHDVQATACISIAWCLLVVSKSKWKYWVAGLLTGGTLFISMLPVVVCIGVGLFVLSVRQFKAIASFAAGGVIGILPVFLYNWFLFGSVFAFPNSISGTTDTSPFFSLTNSIEKIQFYLFSPVHSLFAFMPVLFFAAVGVWFFDRKYRREAVFIVSVCLAHLVYVSTIQTVGHAQYGPRYLLPILPFLAVGLVGIKKAHPVIQGITILTGLFSACIAVVGAFGGVMYQTIWIHPFGDYLRQLLAGETSATPLTLLAPLFWSIAALCFYCAFTTSSPKV